MINLKLLKRLGELFSFKTPEEVDEFLEIIQTIATLNDPDYLPFLFAFLQDDPEYVDVRDSIMFVIEGYPLEIYVTYLLKALKNQFIRTPWLCEILISRLLNTELDKNCLKKYIYLADKETMLKILDNKEINKYCPEQHKPIIAELRSLVNAAPTA